MNIFSKVKAFALALYFLYNLQIKLENGEKPFIRTIYLLSTVEQEALKEFIHESLNTRFIIWSMSFSYRASILFVKKKDSFLHLYINFQRLNHIT